MPSVKLEIHSSQGVLLPHVPYSAVHLQLLNLKFQISNLRFYQNSHSKLTFNHWKVTMERLTQRHKGMKSQERNSLFFEPVYTQSSLCLCVQPIRLPVQPGETGDGKWR
jgi:hypothetical protein